MDKKFIFVTNKEIHEKLVSLGFKLLKETENYSIFLNEESGVETFSLDFSQIDGVVLSNTLSF